MPRGTSPGLAAAGGPMSVWPLTRRVFTFCNGHCLRRGLSLGVLTGGMFTKLSSPGKR
jgi:hypothetical protein